MPHPAAVAPPRRRSAGATRRAAGTALGAVALAAALTAVPGPAPHRARADAIAEVRRERDGVALQLAQMRRLLPDEGAATVEPAPAPPSAPGPAAPLAQAPALPLDEARRAGFEVRLGQLEELLRGLTGRIEQLEFEQRRVNERLDRLIADLDVRLSALEAGGDDAAAAADRRPETAERGTEQAAAPPSPPEEGLLDRLPSGAELATPETDAAPPAPGAGGTAEAGDPITQYHAAMDLLRAGDYAAAETALAAFTAAYPDHQLAANAAYWLAETHYVRKNYTEAAASFARNYRTYGADAAKGPDNLLKLGMSLEALGDTEKACQVFAELGNAFPDAPAHIEQAVARERSRAGCA